MLVRRGQIKRRITRTSQFVRNKHKMLNKICLSFLLNTFFETFLNARRISFHTFTSTREKEFA